MLNRLQSAVRLIKCSINFMWAYLYNNLAQIIQKSWAITIKIRQLFLLFLFTQSVDSDIWSYYMLSMSFYWALTVSQFFDIKRKDFWQMFIHHLVTLLLLSLSWVCNLHRVGSLVLVVHDCADIFLEAAKITKYANYQKLCDCIFAFFTLIWIVTRLGFYPRIIYSSSVEAPRILPMFPAYYIFNSLLILLLLLHVAWTYLILKIAHSSLKSGQVRSTMILFLINDRFVFF